MRFARCEVDGIERVAHLEGDRMVLLDTDDLLGVLMRASEVMPTGEIVDIDKTRVLAPIKPRRNVMCVGWNYLPHFEEGSAVHGDVDLPDRPTFFSKSTTTVIGPYDDIPSHVGVTSELDYEVELGVVIGREVRDLSEDNALSAVAGYFVANDVSARDLQTGHGGQWFKGKSLDGTCPIGPWVTTVDEVGDPQALDIALRLNDELMQSTNTRHMIFPVRKLLAELSTGLTLLPGDILLTGTPEGVGFSRTPPVFLRPGDVLESSVEGLGSLRNLVV